MSSNAEGLRPPDKSEIEARLRDVTTKYGSWSYDVPLPHGVWTKGNLGIPHTRIKRIVQIASDLAGKPLSSCRVLDLGCLEGQFSLEFALQGASVVGIEVREANIEKARLLKWAMQIDNVDFVQDDARNISVGKYGRFDAIVCSGLLYHLTAGDAIGLIDVMREMAPLAIIDTHFALSAEKSVTVDGHTYSGCDFVEHDAKATEEQKAKALWASADNLTSFWFTRPSLINAMQQAGFSSVYECFTPAHLNYGKPGLECADRGTFVGVNGEPALLVTSPAANDIREDWPEDTLSYAAPLPRPLRLLHKLLGN